MNLSDTHFSSIDWSRIPREEHTGEEGTSYWQTAVQGDTRLRTVEYSAGFLADHYCPRGHIIFVIEGMISLQFKDGTRRSIGSGMSAYLGNDEQNPHLATSERGAKVFIID